MINLSKNTQALVLSKKIQRQNKKKMKIEFMQKIKHCKTHISFFIDPFLCHRIYRDFLIPNKQFTNGEPIYYYKPYLAYKSISQVHIRERGVVLQFNDYLPDYITPMGLLKDRLNSVGNKHCHELAEYLPLYYEHFECNKDEYVEKSQISKNIFDENEPLISKTSKYGKILCLIDEIFQEHSQDLVLLGLNKVNKGCDDRLHMLGFNKDLIQWLVYEDEFEKLFENDLIDQLLKIFSYFSMDHYMENLTNIVKNFPIKGLKGKINPINDFFIQEINTKRNSQ